MLVRSHEDSKESILKVKFQRKKYPVGLDAKQNVRNRTKNIHCKEPFYLVVLKINYMMLDEKVAPQWLG